MPPRPARGSLAVMFASLLLLTAPAPRASEMEEDVVAESSLAAPPRRLRVTETNGDEIDIRECLKAAVAATNSENLDDFCACFTGPARTKLRKQVAFRFVEHDVAMELLDSQVIKVGKTTGEVAVKYRLVLSDDRFDVVSLVAVKQESGSWRINSEKIQSYEHQSPSMCSPSRYACLGATCRLETR